MVLLAYSISYSDRAQTVHRAPRLFLAAGTRGETPTRENPKGVKGVAPTSLAVPTFYSPCESLVIKSQILEK